MENKKKASCYKKRIKYFNNAIVMNKHFIAPTSAITDNENEERIP